MTFRVALGVIADDLYRTAAGGSLAVEGRKVLNAADARSYIETGKLASVAAMEAQRAELAAKWGEVA